LVEVVVVEQELLAHKQQVVAVLVAERLTIQAPHLLALELLVKEIMVVQD
jgi:hypothetical protein